MMLHKMLAKLSGGVGKFVPLEFFTQQKLRQWEFQPSHNTFMKKSDLHNTFTKKSDLYNTFTKKLDTTTEEVKLR